MSQLAIENVSAPPCATAPPAPATSCRLPFIWWHPKNENAALKKEKYRPYSHPELCEHLNINKRLLQDLIAIIEAHLPKYDKIYKDDICAELSQIEFPGHFSAILDNAKYDEAHVGLLLYKVYLVSRRREGESKRRSCIYAHRKALAAARQEAATILLKNFDRHGLSIHLLRGRVSEPLVNFRQFGARLEALSEAFGDFENEFAINIALSAQGDKEANDLEPLIQQQAGLSAKIAELERDVKIFDQLEDEIEMFEQFGNNDELYEQLEGSIINFEHELREIYGHLLI